MVLFTMQITSLHPDLLNKSLPRHRCFFGFFFVKAQVFLRDCSKDSEAVVGLELVVLTTEKAIVTYMGW